MKYWTDATVAASYGVFLYCVTLGKLWLALIPVMLIVVIATVQRFRTSSIQTRAPFWMFVVLFMLTALAYLLPEKSGYAATLGIASCVFTFIALVRKEE